MSTEEDNWEEQLKQLEEAEELEKSATSLIPSKWTEPFSTLLKTIPLNKRISIYKLMQYLQWDSDRLGEFHNVLNKVPNEHHQNIINLMNGYCETVKLQLSLEVMSQIPHKQVVEFVSDCHYEKVDYLMEIVRFLPKKEIIVMTQLISELSVLETISMLKACEDPFSKHCRLCRKRRSHQLQQRMVHEQVPTGIVYSTGTLQLYDHSRTWTVDDCKGFSFNNELGQVLYENEEVDLVWICDACLGDVNHAMTSISRFEEIYHLVPKDRKDRLHEIRESEKIQSIIIGKVAKARIFRRIREFSLHALAEQRHGLRLEREEQARQLELMEKKRLLAEKQAMQKALIDAALRNDAKWQESDKFAGLKRMDSKINFTKIQKYQKFDAKKPAPMERQSSLTWRLKLFDDEDTPITEEGAAKAFGSGYELQQHDDLPQIEQWKEDVNDRLAKFQERQNELKSIDELKTRQRSEELNSLIKTRAKVLDRMAEREERLKKQQEIDRIQRRESERVEKRGQRFQKFLEWERQVMVHEDLRSYSLRFFEWEGRVMERELDGMRKEEKSQRELDRFWGLDVFHHRMDAEEKRLRRLYEERVKQLNLKLSQVKAIHPIIGQAIVQSDAVTGPSNPKSSKINGVIPIDTSHHAVNGKTRLLPAPASSQQLNYSLQSLTLHSRGVSTPLISAAPSPASQPAVHFPPIQSSPSRPVTTMTPTKGTKKDRLDLKFGVDASLMLSKSTSHLNQDELLKVLKAEEVRGELHYRLSNLY